MDFIDLKDEVTRKRAIRLLAIVIVIVVIVGIIAFFTSVVLPTLIGTVIVICIVAFVGHKIYVKYRQSMSPDLESGRT